MRIDVDTDSSKKLEDEPSSAPIFARAKNFLLPFSVVTGLLLSNSFTRDSVESAPASLEFNDQDFRIATFNAYGKPNIFTGTKQSRFKEISNLLSNQDLDLIAFQEIWFEHAQEAFPTDESWEKAATEQWPLDKDGLFVLTKHKILSSDALTFQCSAGSDRKLEKGALLVKISLSDGTQINACNIHLQHGVAQGDVRAEQFKELVDWLVSCKALELPTFLLGDFNCESHDPEFSHLNTLLRDRGIGLTEHSVGSTYDVTNNNLAHGDHEGEIDHILLLQELGDVTLSGSANRIGQEGINTDEEYSDHYGVLASYKFPSLYRQEE